MALYQRIRELWKNPRKNIPEQWTSRLINWRKEPSTVKLERPTRLDRARSLGYKAKQGIIVVRQRVPKGAHYRPQLFRKGGRRPKHNRQLMILDKSYQLIAEQRANIKYINMEVLNSYWVAEDGKHKWFEVILVDRSHPRIKGDKNLAKLVEQRGRVFRGLTSTAIKSRGLRNKGKGAEKFRPSKTAVYKRKMSTPRKIQRIIKR